MPSIAQQDYIFIPILDGGELSEDLLTQEIQNRLVQLAQDGRALDVVFCEGVLPDKFAAGCAKVVAFNSSPISAIYRFFDQSNGEMATVSCHYQEIVPDDNDDNDDNESPLG